jgi:hypothetical protein
MERYSGRFVGNSSAIPLGTVARHLRVIQRTCEASTRIRFRYADLNEVASLRRTLLDEWYGDVSTTALYDSRKSIMTGADRNQFVLNPT